MKQLRKDDGYILVYVLVVFLVLSFAAVAICTGAVQNLRAQQASIARTQALYEAEGKIESYVANLMTKEVASSSLCSSEDDAKRAAAAAFWEAAKTPGVELSATVENEGSTQDLNILTVQAISGGRSATVVAKLSVTLELHANQDTSDPVKYKGSAKVKTDGIQYSSYDISYSTGGDAE